MVIKRDSSIDIAKGLCIILVVMGHILQYNTILGMNQPIFNFIYSFHMPVFMLLAGCVAAFQRDKVTCSNFGYFMKKKIEQLVVPFIFWGVLVYPFINDHYYIAETFNLLSSLLKNPSLGPWFLLNLFCIHSLFLCVCLISNKLKCSNKLIGEFISMGSLLIACYVIIKITKMDVGEYVYNYFTPQYILFFFIGYFINAFYGSFWYNRHIFTIAIFVFSIFVPYYVFGKTSFIMKFPISFSASFIILTFSNMLCRCNLNFKSIKTLFVFLGQNSLIIYLVHYLFVKGSVYNLTTNGISNFLLFFMIMILAVFISLLCICTAKIIQPSKLFSKLMFGKTSI